MEKIKPEGEFVDEKDLSEDSLDSLDSLDSQESLDVLKDPEGLEIREDTESPKPLPNLQLGPFSRRPGLMSPLGFPEGEAYEEAVKNDPTDWRNHQKPQRPRQLQFVIPDETHGPNTSNVNTTEASSSGTTVSLLTPAQQYEKIERDPARVAQKQAAQKMREEFNREINMRPAYAHIQRHRPLLVDDANPALDIRMQCLASLYFC